MHSKSLSERIAIITGGASGIGFASTKQLLQDGAICVIWDKDEKGGEHAIKELSDFGSVYFHLVDVTNPVMIAEAASNIASQFGNPNILVNSAGIIGEKGNLWEIDSDNWVSVISANLIGCYNVCYRIIPLMLNADYGKIVNVASVSGKDGSIYASHYSASKAGIIALSKSLAKELAPFNILVNCVTPSATNTPMHKAEPLHDQIRQISKIPLGRIAEAEEVAKMIEWLCTPECSFSTGAVFDVSGGRSSY